MSHNENTLFPADDLPQRLCLYPGFYSGVLFYLLALSSKVHQIIRRLYHCLISPASQRKVDSVSGKFIILRIGKAVIAHADADGHCHFISDIDGFYFIQKIKLIVPQGFDRLFAENYHILVLFDFFADTVQRGNIFIYLSVDQRHQKRSSDLLHAFQRLVVIVKIDHPHCKALIIHLLQCDPQCGLIKKIKGDEIPFIVLSLYDVTV